MSVFSTVAPPSSSWDIDGAGCGHTLILSWLDRRSSFSQCCDRAPEKVHFKEKYFGSWFQPLLIHCIALGWKQERTSGQAMNGGVEEVSTESRKQTGRDKGPSKATTLSVQQPSTTSIANSLVQKSMLVIQQPLNKLWPVTTETTWISSSPHSPGPELTVYTVRALDWAMLK